MFSLGVSTLYEVVSAILDYQMKKLYVTAHENDLEGFVQFMGRLVASMF